MFTFFGSLLNTLNSEHKTKTIISNAEINRKIAKETYEPVQEKQRWINDINGKKRNTKINQRSYENRIRKIVSNYFNTEFIKVRPEWLINPLTQRRLEMDIFSPTLNICIEVQGIQHTQYCPWFHKNEKQFQDQIIRDHIKAKKLQEKGIKLICVHHYEIPYGNDVLDSDLLQIVLDKLAKII